MVDANPDDPNHLTYDESWMDPRAMRYIQRFKEEIAPMLESSAFFMSVSDPSHKKVDIKFATELGYALCLGKPIVMCRTPGQKISDKVDKIVDAWIDVDWDAPDFKEKLAEDLNQVMKDLETRGLIPK